MATCPDCDFDDIDTADIDTADIEEGDTLSCPECGKNLVVLLGADELDFADEDDDEDDETLTTIQRTRIPRTSER